MSNLAVFNFESKEVRTLAINGEPWFVAQDVCKILDNPNTTQACSRLKDYEKGYP